MAFALLVQLTVLFLLSQHLHVPENASTGVAVLVGKDRALCWDLAGRVCRVGSSDRTLSQPRHGAVPAVVPEKFLDAHLDGRIGVRGWQ